MNQDPSRRWFDSHLDLAYLAVNGRNMKTQPDRNPTSGGPASITLPSLREAGVDTVLATIFTEAGGNDLCSYPSGDVEAAHAAGKRQLKIYQDWESSGDFRHFRRGESTPALSAIRYGILIECADPIRSPDELGWWKDQGVVAVGLSWWKSSRYAGGNGTEEGLTDAGRDLLQAMEELEIVPDLSHLSQRGTDELLEATSRPVIASHSNCRSLLDGKDQRHLSDPAILEIGRRGGMIGINLISPFLTVLPGYLTRPITEDSPRATLDHVARHTEHVCEIQGHRGGVGLGSDADGGVSAWTLPRGIDGPNDYEKIAQTLGGIGWTEPEINGFCYNSWARFWNLEEP